MFLQANPNRGKTDEEKEELRRTYKAGDEVMAKIELKRESSADAEDRRMVEEVREMSLQEVGARATGAYERGTRHRQRDNDQNTREDDSRRRRREHGRRRRHEEQAGAEEGLGRSVRNGDSTSQARHIEHQSSLRSLISSSDVDSAEMEAEILRQITEEGLLDGVDLNNLDISQEDELSERIADAYRRRHGQSLRSSNARGDDSRESSRRQERERPRHREQHLSPPAEQATHPSHPPISRPHLFEAYPTGNGHRRRTSSEHRRQTSPATSASRAATDTQRQAARSATDLSDRTRTTPNTQARPVENSRRLNSANRQHSAESTPRVRSHSRQASASSAANPQSQTASPGTSERHGQAITSQSASTPPVVRSDQAAALPERNDTSSERRITNSIHRPDTTAVAPSSAPSASRLPNNPYMDTFVSCNRCGKANIAWDLHHNCSICENGRYNLCNRCYRLGKGCLHWYGFGKAALHHYHRQAPPGGYPPDHPLPHVLRSRRYLDPEIEIRLSSGPRHTIPDPAKRLETGFFCSNCSAFANQCFWKCERCNDGEWGFCNPCVNQGKCCTHPLLPVTHNSLVSKDRDRPLNSSNPNLSLAPIIIPRSQQQPQQQQQPPDPHSTPLTFNTACDICTNPIPPSSTRFHCQQCNNGDYDICTTCYPKLVNSDRISARNGDKGWRRCLQGHRMIIVGFEPGPLGQRRVVVRDLVGGYALKDEPSSYPSSDPASGPAAGERKQGEWSWSDEGTRKTHPSSPSNSPSLGSSSSASAQGYPPSGGVGFVAVALWAYWPSEDAADELAFPKGAEIREGMDINGDWLWGVYCGRGGLWPGGYARVVR